MIVGIDASNVRTGGSVTHLRNLLRAAKPAESGIEKMIVWAGRKTLAVLPDRPWLEKAHDDALDRSLPHRLLWQWTRLPRLARNDCEVLFSPGGNAPRGFTPLVTMSRNMLPFEWDELSRYGFSLATLRLLLLRFGQSRTFKRADGVIFLTKYAHDAVREIVAVQGKVAIIPHGIEDRFKLLPREQRSRESVTPSNPLRLLYVSVIDQYKHQWNVAEAVARLRREGLPLIVDFVGASFPRPLARLRKSLRRLDPSGDFLRYRGPVPFEELHRLRECSDLFVFASSCENMPNSLLEAMASGFPIACAQCGPMPEILGDGGVYFDPEDARSIAEALRSLADDPSLRTRCAQTAYERSLAYSWERCARETLAFLNDVAAR